MKLILIALSVIAYPYVFAAENSLSEFKIENRVNECFQITATMVKDESIPAANLVRKTLILESKRLKAQGSDWQPEIDCCPKYSRAYAYVKDARGKSQRETLISRPDSVGEITETKVSISDLIKDPQTRTPITVTIKCN
jgi:hypothetical protein